MDNLISVQYQKIEKIEDYIKTHKPNSDLTNRTYRALSDAYINMLRYQKIRQNTPQDLTENSHKALSQKMSHSQDMYNEWQRQYGMLPTHNKSDDTGITNSNMATHVGRAIKNTHQHIVEIKNYLLNHPSDVKSQELLNSMNNVCNIFDRYYEFMRAGKTLTTHQTTHMYKLLQTCNTSLMQWRSTIQQGGSLHASTETVLAQQKHHGPQGGSLYKSTETVLAQQKHHGRIIQPHQSYHNQHGHSPVSVHAHRHPNPGFHHSRPVIWRSGLKDVVSLYATTQSAEAQSPGKTKNAVRFATDTCDAPVNPYTIDKISE